MSYLRWHDLVRFLIGWIAMFVIDLANHSLFDLPLNTDAENTAFALGFVLLCAIRESTADTALRGDRGR